MDKPLSFFRVFDIAFFAPGMLLFGALWHAGYLPVNGFAQGQDTVHGVLSAAYAIVLIYLLGLICHGIQRGVLWLFRSRKGSKDPSWYANLQANNPRHEFAIYFWYMRATCWNIAVALIPCAFLFRQYPLGVLVDGIIVLILIALGCDFDKGMRDAANGTPVP
jgi:hypothetical protein